MKKWLYSIHIDHVLVCGSSKRLERKFQTPQCRKRAIPKLGFAWQSQCQLKGNDAASGSPRLHLLRLQSSGQIQRLQSRECFFSSNLRPICWKRRQCRSKCLTTLQSIRVCTFTPLWAGPKKNHPLSRPDVAGLPPLQHGATAAAAQLGGGGRAREERGAGVARGDREEDHGERTAASRKRERERERMRP